MQLKSSDSMQGMTNMEPIREEVVPSEENKTSTPVVSNIDSENQPDKVAYSGTSLLQEDEVGDNNQSIFKSAIESTTKYEGADLKGKLS